MGGAHFLPSLPLSLRVRVRVHFHASRVNVVRIQRFASIDKSCAQVSPRAYYHPRRTHARCGKAFAQLPACRVKVRVRVRVSRVRVWVLQSFTQRPQFLLLYLVTPPISNVSTRLPLPELYCTSPLARNEILTLIQPTNENTARSPVE